MTCTVSDHPLDIESPLDMNRDNERFTVADVYKQATLIGQDLEEINRSHGNQVAERLMPKLVTVLGKLEDLLIKHDDNKSKIKALRLENEDLEEESKSGEDKKERLNNQLEESKTILDCTEKKLKMKVKLLEMENKVLTKEVKKKDKKIKRVRRGNERSTFLWILDRVLFGGRLFFISTELPRDVAAVANLNVTMTTQTTQINRLCSAVEKQGTEKESLAMDLDRLSCMHDCLELEISVMKRRLAKFETEDDEDIALNIQRSYENRNEGNEYIRSFQVNRFGCDYDNNYSRHNSVCVSISDDISESRYWDVLSSPSRSPVDALSSRSRSPEDETFMFETAVLQPYDDEVETRMACLSSQNVISEAKICEIDGEEMNIENKIMTRTEPNKYEIPELSTSSRNENHYEVTVDIHANRKDYKKLLLTQELRDSIATMNDQNNVSHHETYHHSDNDVIRTNGAGKTCFWDEVDSKTSYEDLSNIGDSTVNHLDDEKKSVKGVDSEEHKSVIHEPIDKISHIENAEKPSAEHAYNFKVMDRIVQIHTEKGKCMF